MYFNCKELDCCFVCLPRQEPKINLQTHHTVQTNSLL